MMGQAFYKVESEADFLRKVNAIMNMKYPKEKQAHSVKRTIMILKGDHKVPYQTTLHYAPEIGYWGCIKDNHGNLVFNTDAYCLASTVREVMMEELFTINKGELNE